MSNFGFLTEKGSHGDTVIFTSNDFDDACVGRAHWDIIRLLTIEDNSGSQFPDAISFFPNFSYANTIRIGDTVSASGPLNFSFGTYRINPTEVISVTSIREDTPVISEGILSVATFNVLNYFNGDVDENGELTFDYDNNRGAESEAALALQEGRIVEAIVDLNADVVGLMEIENNGFGDDSTIQSLLNAINAQLGEAEQYAFISTADNTQIGTEAITVGLMYRGTVVTPQGDAVIVAMLEQQISEDSLADAVDGTHWNINSFEAY
ncbi:DUF2252 family protein [Alteromonas sp. A081]|uniref:DUF2252 family protein n=1 Tax=Alteromonas sp. A081 TaxID=3410269 RepID=UPI003B97F792